MIDKNHFGGHKCLDTHTARSVSNSTGFNTEHENTCSFPSHIGSSIPIFRDMYLHLIVSKKI